MQHIWQIQTLSHQANMTLRQKKFINSAVAQLCSSITEIWDNIKQASGKPTYLH